MPPVLSDNSVLAARLTFQKNSTSSDSIASSFDTTFVGGGAADHGDLAGLTDIDHPHEAGGLEADVSAYDGLVGVTG